MVADAEAIAAHLPELLLRLLLEQERIAYPVLRTLLSSLDNKSNPLLQLHDVDEAILRNDNFIRSHAHKPDEDDSHLVTLNHLVRILSGTVRDDVLQFQRNDVPPGGFNMLDMKRKTFSANSEYHRGLSNRIPRAHSWYSEGA